MSRNLAARAVLFVGLAASVHPPVARSANDDWHAAAPFGMPVEDNRIFAHMLFDQLEGRFGGTEPGFRWDGEGWIGTDQNRLWLKSEGSVITGTAKMGQHELLYGRPVNSFWDLQAGLRYDLDSFPSRGWAAIGIEGLAPNFFQLSATFYASDGGHFAAKLLVAYEQLITQRLIVEPLIELNAYTESDPARNVASGLSDVDTGVRLRYEVSRKFAPYLGVVYERTYGPANQPVGVGIGSPVEGTDRSGDWRLALGVRTWF